jgi:hypothetical protein
MGVLGRVLARSCSEGTKAERVPDRPQTHAEHTVAGSSFRDTVPYRLESAVVAWMAARVEMVGLEVSQ